MAINQAISYFSDSIRAKIPASRHVSNVQNALWILRNPVRLTPLEKDELITLVQTKLSEGMRK